MLLTSSLLPLLSLATSASAALVARSAATSCAKIKTVISPQSAVFYPGSSDYAEDMERFMPLSIQNSTCAVEPATASDVTKIIRILAQDKTPFGIKGGGHAFNKGHSSTLGVQIAMKRFNSVSYDAQKQLVSFGSGLLWDTVYEYLDPHGVTVAGGRAPGVGAAGFILGGGYAWVSNQYGLSADTLVEAEVVLPNGSVTTASASKNPDLFWALKGGFNNFGIVTKFTLKTFPQTLIHGGRSVFSANYSSQVIDFAANFVATVTDPKAAIIVAFGWLNKAPYIATYQFYDGPNPPAGIFDDLVAIPTISADVKSRSFFDYLKAAPSLEGEVRSAHDTVPILDNSKAMLNAIQEAVLQYGKNLSAIDPGFRTAIAAEPFLPNMLFAPGPSVSSAYPPSRKYTFTPASIDFGWVLPSADDVMISSMKQAVRSFTDTARQLGQPVDEAVPYPNYAYDDITAEKAFGAALPQLKQIKKKYDPSNIMGQAGGWKV